MKSTKTKLTFILPEGLIEKIQSKLTDEGTYTLTKRNKPTQDSVNLLHKYLYIPNLLLQSKVYQRDSYTIDGVQISFESTKSLLGLSSEGTKSIINYLIDAGIIELVSTHIFWGKGSNENKCRSYKLTTEWEAKKIYQHECPTDATFISKLIPQIASSPKQSRSEVNDSIVKYQMKMFQESVGVHSTVYDYFYKKYGYTADQLKNENVKVDVKDYLLLSIINKNVRISRPDQLSRIYTPLTSIKKELRQYLTLDGKSLIGLDVVNCQLLMSAIAIEHYFKENNPGIELPDDFHYYKQLAEEGNLYETLAEAEGKLKLLQTNRTAYKQRLYKGFFFAKNGRRLNKTQRAFQSLFPAVFDFIVEIKANNKYNKWAILLQQTESQIMLDIVTGKLIESSIKVLNLHDGLYFSSLTDLKFAEEILLNCLNDFGIKGKTKTEQYPEPTELPIEEEKDKNINWFKITTGKELNNFWFKTADTYFNVKELTVRIAGKKRKKLSKNKFLNLYTIKLKEEQEYSAYLIEKAEEEEKDIIKEMPYHEFEQIKEVEAASIKIIEPNPESNLTQTGFKRLNLETIKGQLILSQIKKVKELTGVQLDLNELDYTGVIRYSGEYEFAFGDYNLGIHYIPTRRIVNYVGRGLPPIEQFYQDITSVLRGELIAA